MDAKHELGIQGPCRLLRDLLCSTLVLLMAPKGKLLASRRRPASHEAGGGSRASSECRTMHRDDRLPNLVIPKCEQINLPELMLHLIRQCFYNPRRSMPYACPITSLLLFIGIHIPNCELVTLKSRSGFNLTAAHRMGYKLLDGVVTRELKGKEQATDEDESNEDDVDEDSQSEPMDAQGDEADVVADDQAPDEPSLRDFISAQMAQMQLQMITVFEHLNARLDHVDTSLEALADTQVQLQIRLTRLSTELHELRQSSAPPGHDDVSRV
ncbi:hypothetical protein Taro_022360 [Colocasia esculenta]|uniref:Uncharacterized protein n=1 Tax=Colocasia esculenta TaxID=4460 RepID=A0A843V1L0_COLES|nr:hypothetical protein [Colocasia esculenta]